MGEANREDAGARERLKEDYSSYGFIQGITERSIRHICGAFTQWRQCADLDIDWEISAID